MNWIFISPIKFLLKSWRLFCWNFEIWAVQKYVHLVDLIKSFPTNIHLQRSVSIQPRTSHLIFIILAASRDLIFTERSSPSFAGKRWISIWLGQARGAESFSNSTAKCKSLLSQFKCKSLLIHLAANSLSLRAGSYISGVFSALEACRAAPGVFEIFLPFVIARGVPLRKVRICWINLC